MPSLTPALAAQLRSALATARAKPEPERTAQLFDVVDRLLAALDAYVRVVQVAESASGGAQTGLRIDSSGNIALQTQGTLTLASTLGARITLDKGEVRITGREVAVKQTNDVQIKGAKLASELGKSPGRNFAIGGSKIGNN
jgi:hypothetical protein